MATTWFPTPGSPATGSFVAKDVAALSENNDVRVLHLVAPRLAAGAPTQTEVGGVPVERVVMEPKDPRQHGAARAAIVERASDADVLHTMAFSTLLPFLRHDRPQVPWVHTEHWHGVTTRVDLPLVMRLATPLLLPVLRKPDVVTAVSKMATAPIRDLRGDRPTSVVPCIAATPAVVPARRVRAGTTAEGAPLRLVSVGAMIPGKDPVLMVETLGELRRRGVNASLTWVGDGPLHGDALAAADRLRVRDHLTITGQVEPDVVFTQLAAADVFVLPTRSETFGVAIAEALAHGRPVVVGAEGAQREYVRGEVGTFVEGRSPSDWADAVLHVDEETQGLSAAQIAASIGRAFSPQSVVAGFERAYRDAIATAAREHGIVGRRRG